MTTPASSANSCRRTFPHDFYTHFIYLEDEPALGIHELLMNNDNIGRHFEKAESVHFRSTAFQPPRNRIPQRKEDVEMTVEWSDETEVITLEDACYNGLINLHTIEDMKNLAQGSMSYAQAAILWQAIVWRPKMDAHLCQADVEGMQQALDKDNFPFELLAGVQSKK